MNSNNDEPIVDTVDDQEVIAEEENYDLEGFKDYLTTSDKVDHYLQVESPRFHKSNLVS